MLRLISRIFQQPRIFATNYSSSATPNYPLVLNDCDLVESFIKGSGKGGQAINTNKSCVQLVHTPTSLRVQTQRFRLLQQNRVEARKLLHRKVEEFYFPEKCRNTIERDKRRKKDANKARKARKKYGVGKEEESIDDDDKSS